MVTAFGVGSAQAASVGSTLFTGFQQLSDNSAEYLINGDPEATDTTLDVGDVLRGIFTIETLEQAPSPTRFLGGASGNDELTGIFEIQVLSKSGGPGAYAWTFGPSANFTSVYGDGAMVAFYADAANNFTRVNDGTCTDIACMETRASDGSLFWVSGFAGLAGEFWNATAVTDDVSAVGSIPAPGVGGGYNAAINVLVNNSGKSIDKVACFNLFTLTLGFVDQCGSGSLLGTGGVATPFDSFDNVDFTMSIPEPSSLALMGIGLLGAAAAARRRKKA